MLYDVRFRIGRNQLDVQPKISGKCRGGDEGSKKDLRDQIWAISKRVLVQQESSHDGEVMFSYERHLCKHPNRKLTIFR